MDLNNGEDVQKRFETMVDQCLSQFENNVDVHMASNCLDDNDDSDLPLTSSMINNSSNSFQSHNNTVSSLSRPSTSNNNNRDIFYCENYLDLNDILTQSNRVSVTFQRTIPKLGFLDSGAEVGDKLVKGTKLGISYLLIYIFE